MLAKFTSRNLRNLNNCDSHDEEFFFLKIKKCVIMSTAHAKCWEDILELQESRVLNHNAGEKRKKY